MTKDMSRREQLIAGAVARELTVQEQRELEQWCADDAEVADELAEMMALVGRLDAADLTWTNQAPDAALARAVEEAVETEQVPMSSRRPVLRMAAAAAVLLIAGAGVGLGADRFLNQPETVVSGPAGTLGAVEPLAASADVPGASVDVSLVAHTWGTETVLKVDGFTEGAPYDVVLLDREGRSVDSGSFVGSRGTIDCRLNAAVMRADVAAIEIIQADGTVVLDAEVPPVSS